MTKPLHEMNLNDVLDLLTPTQRDSVLAYARQFARSNAALSNRATNNPSQAAYTDELKVAPGARSQVSSTETATQPASWYIDGRVRKPMNALSPPHSSLPNAKPQSRKKEKKKKSKRKQEKSKTRTRIRVVQGGLCSPR